MPIPTIQGLRYLPIPGDGNCFFNAVAIHLGEGQDELRRRVADHLREHADENGYRELIQAENRTIETYTQELTNRLWGGQIEQQILMDTFHRAIIILRPQDLTQDGEPILNLALADDARYPGDPIFVYYDGVAHYDTYEFLDGATGRDVLQSLHEEGLQARILSSPSTPTASQMPMMFREDPLPNLPVPIAHGLTYEPVPEQFQAYALLGAVAYHLRISVKSLRHLLVEYLNLHADLYQPILAVTNTEDTTAFADSAEVSAFIGEILNFPAQVDVDLIQASLARMLDRPVLTVRSDGKISESKFGKQFVAQKEQQHCVLAGDPLLLFCDDNMQYGIYRYNPEMSPVDVLNQARIKGFTVPKNKEEIKANVVQPHTQATPYPNSYAGAREFVFDLATINSVALFKEMLSRKPLVCERDEIDRRLLTCRERLDIISLEHLLIDVFENNLEQLLQQLRCAKDNTRLIRQRTNQLEILEKQLTAQSGVFMTTLLGRLSEAEPDDTVQWCVDGNVRELTQDALIGRYETLASEIVDEYKQLFRGWIYPLSLPIKDKDDAQLTKQYKMLRRRKDLEINDEEHEMSFLSEQEILWREANATQEGVQVTRIKIPSDAKLPERFRATDASTQQRLLATRVAYHVVNEEGDNLAHELARQQDIQTFSWLNRRNNRLATQKNVHGVRAIDARTAMGETMMHALAKGGDLTTIQDFLALEPDLSLSDKTIDRTLPLDTLCIRRNVQRLQMEDESEDDSRSRQASFTNKEQSHIGTTLLMQVYAADKHDVFRELLSLGADPMKAGLHNVTLLSAILERCDDSEATVRENNERFLDMITQHLIDKQLSDLWPSGLDEIEKRLQENLPEGTLLGEQHMPSVQLNFLRGTLAGFLKDFILEKYNAHLERWQRYLSKRVRIRYRAHFQDVEEFLRVLRQAYTEGKPMKIHAAVTNRNAVLTTDPASAGLKKIFYPEPSPLMKCILPIINGMKTHLDRIGFEKVRQEIQDEARSEGTSSRQRLKNVVMETKLKEQEAKTARLQQQQATDRAAAAAREAAAEAREAAAAAREAALRADLPSLIETAVTAALAARAAENGTVSTPVGENRHGFHATGAVNTESAQSVVSPMFRGLQFAKVPGDGHCLFHAIGMHIGQDAPFLRQIVAANMAANLGEYLPFRDGSREDFLNYIEQIRTGEEWGDSLEIDVIQRLLSRPIVILRPDANPTIPDNLDAYQDEPIFIFYNGQDHYDTFTLEEGVNAREILTEIRKALCKGQDLKYERLAQFGERARTPSPGPSE